MSESSNGYISPADWDRSDEDAYPSVHIGPRLRELCEPTQHRARITQVDIARALAPLNEGRPLDAAVPSTWMGGMRYRPVPGKYLPALAEYLETTIEILISGATGITPRRRQALDYDDEPIPISTEPVIYVVAAISGHTVGQLYYDAGPRPVPGRPTDGTPAGFWRLSCRKCGQRHEVELGEHAPRTCVTCGRPLAAKVRVKIVKKPVA